MTQKSIVWALGVVSNFLGQFRGAANGWACGLSIYYIPMKESLRGRVREGGVSCGGCHSFFFSAVAVAQQYLLQVVSFRAADLLRRVKDKQWQ